MIVKKRRLRSIGIALVLLSASIVTAGAQRAEPSAVQRAASPKTLSPLLVSSDTAGRRSISPWPIVVGTMIGAGLGWTFGRFAKGQCETPPCVQRSRDYPTDGLLIGAGVGLVTGIAISAFRAR